MVHTAFVFYPGMHQMGPTPTPRFSSGNHHGKVDDEEFFTGLRSLTKPVHGNVLAWPGTSGSVSTLCPTKDSVSFVLGERVDQTSLGMSTHVEKKRKTVCFD